MTRAQAAAWLLLLAGLLGCGRYGPPERAERRPEPTASQTPEPGPGSDSNEDGEG